MKKFPLYPLPETAGIYALQCEKTSAMYIGQTVNFRRRYQEWKHAMVGGFRSSNRLVAELMKECKDWNMLLLRPMPGATKEELDAAEQEYLLHMQEKHADRLLNVVMAERIASSPAALAVNYIDPITSKSNIALLHRGKPVSKATAANILGVKRETLKKRLQKLHRGGTTAIDIEDLQKK